MSRYASGQSRRTVNPFLTVHRFESYPPHHISPDGGIGRHDGLRSRCLVRESSSLSLGTIGQVENRYIHWFETPANLVQLQACPP